MKVRHDCISFYYQEQCLVSLFLFCEFSSKIYVCNKILMICIFTRSFIYLLISVSWRLSFSMDFWAVAKDKFYLNDPLSLTRCRLYMIQSVLTSDVCKWDKGICFPLFDCVCIQFFDVFVYFSSVFYVRLDLKNFFFCKCFLITISFQ